MVLYKQPEAFASDLSDDQSHTYFIEFAHYYYNCEEKIFKIYILWKYFFNLCKGVLLK